MSWLKLLPNTVVCVYSEYLLMKKYEDSISKGILLAVGVDRASGVLSA